MNAIKQNTWTLVTDGGRARIFRLGSSSGDIEQLQQMNSATAHTPSRELASDSSSRSHHVRGPVGHTKEPRSDPHDLAEQHFIQGVMKKVSRAAQSHDFEQLIIVADPRTLGRLRKCMPHSVSSRTVKEIDLDLTGVSMTEIDLRIRKACSLH